MHAVAARIDLRCERIAYGGCPNEPAAIIIAGVWIMEEVGNGVYCIERDEDARIGARDDCARACAVAISAEAPCASFGKKNDIVCLWFDIQILDT